MSTGVVWEAGVASAASFTQIPERLYMAPGGDPNILDGIAEFVGVDVGTLEFDGDQDPISGDLRQIVVEAAIGDGGCDLSDIDETDPANVGKEDYDIDDCPRVQMRVDHGTLYMGAITLDDVDNPDGSPNPANPVYILPSGAVTDNDYGSGASIVNMNGTPDQLNDALAALVYTPDPGYYYVGSFNPEELEITVIPGNKDDVNPPESTASETKFVQIRVLSPNEFPTHDGPATKTADPGIELLMPENPSPTRPFVADPGENPPIDAAEFTVGDPDNDELIDTDTGDPGELPDGEDENMMLIGFLECGQPVLDDPNIFGTDHGFHFRGGAFQSDDVQIQDFFEILYDVTANPDYQFVIDALVAGLDAIDPDLKNITLATSSPTEYTTAFAGVGDILDVEYALSQITFLHDAPNDTCTLITVVLDLGNNGLPLQYLGSPPTGIEVPFLGFDWNVLEITTGDIETIDVSFETADPIVVSEAAAPTPATARLKISPAIHPEFTIKWDAVPGTALPGEDYAGTSNNTLTIPANTEYYPLDPVPLPSENPIETMVFDNDNPADDAPIESFTFEIITDQNTPPPGWTVTSSVSTKTVNIIDDDGAPNTIVGVSSPSVAEGDTGTTDLVFDVTLSGPATGAEEFVATTNDGTATDADNDYEPFTAQPITFDVGETVGQVTVTVNGDDVDTSDETLTLDVAAASSPTTVLDSGTGTITNDDILVTTDATASVDENASSTFAVQITPANHPPFSLSGTLSPVSATAGTDYDDSVSPITISVPADATTVNVPIAALGDFVLDDGEQYEVDVAPAIDPLGFTVRMGSPSLVTVTIDDVAPADSELSLSDVTVAEGTAASVTVGNTFPARVCQVEVTTTPVSAVAPGDYTAINGAAFDANGDPILVTTVDDIEIESDETFLVTIALTDPPTPGCVIGDGEATVTITSDDVPMEVSIDDGSVAEGATAGLDVHVTNALAPYCAVSVTTAAVPPTSAGDFTAIAGAAFTANDVDTVTVEALQDGDDDDGETFTVTLALTGSSDPRCVIADGEATVTIIDDDGPVDNTPPTVTIDQAAGQSDPTNVGTVEFTVVFSEPVIGFGSSDVVLSGSANPTGATVTGASPGTTFTVAVSPINNPGLVIADVAAGGALDLAGNANTASTSTDNEVTFDPVGPSVTVEQAGGQADPTGASPILFTVVFSEPVTGFQTGDVTLAGTAGATTAVVTGSGTTYSIAVSGMTQDGTVVASLGAGVASDTATNPNDASTSLDNEVTFEFDEGDLTPPSVTVEQAAGQADPTGASPILFTVVFSEPVTGFQTGDVTLAGTAGATTAVVTGSGTTYSVAVSGMTQDGTVIASLAPGVATDASLNPSEASTSSDNQVTFDIDQGSGPPDLTPPTVTIDQAAGQADPTGASPISFTVVFSEPVTGFATGDVTLGGTAGATTATVSGSGATYSVAVSGMTGPGTVIASISAGTAVDAALNPSAASTSTDNVVTYAPDVSAPITLDLPDDITQPNDPGQAGAVVTFPAATASGGVPPVTVTCSRTSGSFFPLGTTTVSCTATDSEANGAEERFVEAIVTDSFTITVIDTEPPVMATPPDLVRQATSTSGTAVSYSTPTATDNAGTPTVTCGPASGAVFKVGVTTVTCTATDAAGNSTSRSFTVTVSAPSSGVPATGSDTLATLLLAGVFVAVGLATRRIGRRGSALAG